MKNWKESPCTGCQRVANSQACDNKDCMRWRRWFFSRWEQLQALYLQREDPCAGKGKER